MRGTTYRRFLANPARWMLYKAGLVVGKYGDIWTLVFALVNARVKRRTRMVRHAPGDGELSDFAIYFGRHLSYWTFQNLVSGRLGTGRPLSTYGQIEDLLAENRQRAVIGIE